MAQVIYSSLCEYWQMIADLVKMHVKQKFLVFIVICAMIVTQVTSTQADIPIDA